MAVVEATPLLFQSVTAADRAIVARRPRRRRRRTVVVSIGLAVAIFVTFCVSISVGDFPIPLRDVVPAIFGFGNEDADFIVRTLRLPRALTGLLVGVAFGLSGAIFQSLARNPLASPDIIGITSGASAAAVFMHRGRRRHRTSRSRSAPSSARCSPRWPSTCSRASGGCRPTGWCSSASAWPRCSPSVTAVPAHPGRDLRRAAGHGVADRQPERPRLGPRAAARRRLVVLVPAVLVLSRPLRALQLGDDTATGLGVRGRAVAARPRASSPSPSPPSPPRRPGRSSSSPSWRRRSPAGSPRTGLTLVPAALGRRPARAARRPRRPAGLRADRAAGRRRHRRRSAPLPALAARPGQQGGTRRIDAHDSSARRRTRLGSASTCASPTTSSRSRPT